MVAKLSAACVVSFLLLGGLHWFPWEKLIGRKLPAPYSYMVGVFALAVVYTAWALWSVPSAAWAVGGLWLIIGSGGGAVLIAYIIDRWLGLETATRHVPVCGGERKRPGADRKGGRRA